MAKYIVERTDGTPTHSGPYFVFSPTDTFITDVVQYYYELCERHGADREFLEQIAEHLDRLKAWQWLNKDKVKYPD